MRVRVLIVSAILMLLLTAGLTAQEAANRRYGIFVGANDGGRGRVTLRWAVADARRVAEVMTEIGGVRPQDAYVLTDPNARDLQSRLADVASRIDSDRAHVRRAEFFFYYSGHSDEHGLMLGDDHLPYADLRAMMNGMNADVTIAILDSCASGAFTRVKGGAFAEPFLIDRGSDVTGHAFLASSSADEASQESDTLGSGFFTHYLVSGLWGAADVSNDRRVTIDEVYHYAREQTLQRTISTLAGPQNPNFDFQLTGTGSLVLTDLANADAAIVFDRSLAGNLFVTRERGGIVAEVRKHEGSELPLAVPAGTYILTLQGENRSYQQRVHVAPGSTVPIAPRDFRVTFLDRTRLRGSEPAPAPLSVTVLPGVELVGEDPYQTTISLGLLVGQAYRVHGAQASSVLSVADENLAGIQLSGVGNVVGGDLIGLQHSGVFNVVRGNSTGVQSAGVFNRVEGHGSVMQAAGVFNKTAAGFDGVQGAGVFNVTDGILNGVQFAGVFNRAGAANGAQIGLVNVGGDVRGAQIGLVNVGNRVTGAQVGLVNISQEMYGVPIGVVTLVDSGIHNASIWWEGGDRTWLGVQNGSHIFYSVAYVGFERGGRWRDLDGFGIGIGAGFRVVRRPFYVDVDAGWKRLTDGDDAQDRFSSIFDLSRGATFPTARMMAGIALGDRLGWFMGGSFDFSGPLSSDAMGYFDSRPNAIGVSAESAVHPGFFTGFRF